ncbi:hypothetical protein M378DRAFT_16891 [Amanita muscaria Koide BX008]|uniref:Uncharacterized protein n=1 Tax=Amanita muscaria (strain Koide BX008) TaxID=946122 RepID=A0A0C2SRM8_AMAMK|nr:hypothetical protein M378DRAFT_16891 [Amanita muscaria Koide BX008]
MSNELQTYLSVVDTSPDAPPAGSQPRPIIVPDDRALVTHSSQDITSHMTSNPTWLCDEIPTNPLLH